jgi:hypothetical protein
MLVALGGSTAFANCNPRNALNLLTKGQTASVNGDKASAVDIQLRAADAAWDCYMDKAQSAHIRGTMGKAAADILNGAAQDADAAGQEQKAIKIAKLALKAYQTIAADRSLPLDIRTYADSAVEAATSP